MHATPGGTTITKGWDCEEEGGSERWRAKWRKEGEEFDCSATPPHPSAHPITFTGFNLKIGIPPSTSPVLSLPTADPNIITHSWEIWSTLQSQWKRPLRPDRTHTKMVFPVGRIVGSTAIDRNVCQIILFSVDVA